MHRYAKFPSASIRFQCSQLALPAMFSLLGLFMGSWASRIATLRDTLHISNSALSWVLLCAGLGAVLSSPLAARLVTLLGSGKTLHWTGVALCLVLPCVGFAPDIAWLMVAVTLLGLTAGSFSIALNLVASKYEKANGAPKMSMFYASICIGSLSGALAGSVIADRDVTPGAHFVGVALLAAAVLRFGYPLLTADGSREFIRQKAFSLPSGPMALLGVLSFCGAVAQTSIADWSGIFLKDHFSAAEGIVPLALSAYTGMMLVSRLMGDRLKEKHGARRLVSIGGLVSASGLFIAAFAPGAAVAVIGFAFAGLGLSFLFPFVFSAAGEESPMASASVASMSNVGGLIGPPVVGTVASYFGMQAVIGFIGLLSLVIAAVAARTNMLNKSPVRAGRPAA